MHAAPFRRVSTVELPFRAKSDNLEFRVSGVINNKRTKTKQRENWFELFNFSKRIILPYINFVFHSVNYRVVDFRS